MSQYCLAFLASLLLITSGTICAQEPVRDYVEVYYSAEPSPSLVVFGDQEAKSVPLPFKLGRLAYDQSGTSLYAQALGTRENKAPSGLVRITFNPTRFEQLKGSDSLKDFSSFAMAPQGNRAVLSGRSKNEGCGLFVLSSPDGALRKVRDDEECSYVSAWLHLSLSPDGRRVVAVHKKLLEIINLETSESTVIGDDYYKAAWSPDGQWIAALSQSGTTTIYNATTLEATRKLNDVDVIWSPNSRYLLGQIPGPSCPPGFGSLEVFDVATGQRQIIESSRCQVNQSTIGWMSRTSLP
jgi:WD40 repeat protein